MRVQLRIKEGWQHGVVRGVGRRRVVVVDVVVVEGGLDASTVGLPLRLGLQVLSTNRRFRCRRVAQRPRTAEEVRPCVSRQADGGVVQLLSLRSQQMLVKVTNS